MSSNDRVPTDEQRCQLDQILNELDRVINGQEGVDDQPEDEGDDDGEE